MEGYHKMFNPSVQSKKPDRCWLILPVLLLLLGCSGIDRPVGLAQLDDPDTLTRIRAIKWAGKNKVTAAIGALIDNLANEDAAVRLVARRALVDITGTDRGYHYKSGPASRAQAIARWRESYENHEEISPKQ